MAKKEWPRILEAVESPLGFFALFLLVIVALLSVASFQLDGDIQDFAIKSLIAVFAGGVLIFGAITAFRPGHLVRKVEKLEETINSEGFRDVIDDAIIQMVKDDCLK